MSNWNDAPSWGGQDSGQGQGQQQNNWRNNDQQSNYRGRGGGGGGGGGGGYRGRGGGGGGGGRGGGGGGFGGDNRSNFVQGNTTIMKVPSRCVGRIIGKGGSKITDLQFESDCKIIVTKDTEDDLTIIKLIGSDENIQKAEMMINDLTVDREPRQQY